MLVKNRMTPDPHTIMANTSISEALNTMREHKIRRLPVVDKRGKLIGIVSEKQLLYASPSPATSLSVYEIGYLLSKLKVEEIMSQDLVIVDANAPLEEAARMMADNEVSGLPVIENGKLVGIITETDIFKVLLEMLGARDSGVRITLKVKDKPGILSAITGAITELNGDIISLGTFYDKGDECDDGRVMLKVSGMDKNVLIKAMNKIKGEVLDVREV